MPINWFCNNCSSQFGTPMFDTNTDKIVKELRKIEGIAKISVISADYDIVVRVEAETLSNINKVTNKIHSINDIKSTNTHIIEKEIAI